MAIRGVGTASNATALGEWTIVPPSSARLR
jgi:hypothetical protein